MSELAPERYTKNTLDKILISTNISYFRSELEAREKDLVGTGVPAYTTAVGWLGYSDEKIR